MVACESFCFEEKIDRSRERVPEAGGQKKKGKKKKKKKKREEKEKEILYVRIFHFFGFKLIRTTLLIIKKSLCFFFRPPNFPPDYVQNKKGEKGEKQMRSPNKVRAPKAHHHHHSHPTPANPPPFFQMLLLAITITEQNNRGKIAPKQISKHSRKD